MFLVPVTILRSLAAGAVIVGVVSVAAALTLLPALLSLIGDGVNALRVPIVGKNVGRSSAAEGRIWRAVIRRVTSRPFASLLLAGGFMLIAAIPVFGLHIGQSGVETLPNNSPSKQGYLAVQRYFPTQDPYPVEIIALGSAPAVHADLAKLQVVLARDPRFGRGVVQTSTSGAVNALAVPIRGDAVSSQAVAAVLDLRRRLIPSLFSGSGATVYVGGQTADEADYFHAVSNPTPYVLLFVLGLSFVLLLLAFRSLMIAAVSILLNLLSIGAAYGILTLVFIHGIAARGFGFQQVTAIDAWVPLFMFSVLFALSMDYQVFLMSRIKERYDESGSTKEAVAGGVASTARIITGAALIIVAVFAGFARGQLVQFEEMGFGVAVALILDATLIRLVVLPSILSLLGHGSWYLPCWLEWIPHFEVEAPDTYTRDGTEFDGASNVGANVSHLSSSTVASGPRGPDGSKAPNATRRRGREVRGSNPAGRLCDRLASIVRKSAISAGKKGNPTTSRSVFQPQVEVDRRRQKHRDGAETVSGSRSSFVEAKCLNVQNVDYFSRPSIFRVRDATQPSPSVRSRFHTSIRRPSTLSGGRLSTVQNGR